jgi:hypothetical protein
MIFAFQNVYAQSLQGSPESMQKQNQEADKENLSRIKNDAELARMKNKKLLVHLPVNKTIRIDPRLEEKYRWCRPWTSEFLIHLGSDFYAHMGNQIQINSAVRTISYQRVLQRKNPNAAPTGGIEASSHLTGSTIDIAKKHMTRGEIRWMRKYLLSLEERNLIEATEEFNQTVFHIMVFKCYSNSKASLKK